MKAKIDVGMIDVFGSDYHVARIARLSRGVPWEVDAAAKMDSEKWSKSTWEENTKTLRFLFEQKHMTPFEFAGATFYIEAPIFVARQLMRYRCASYLERSLRYCKPFEENEEYNKLLADGFKRERARGLAPDNHDRLLHARQFARMVPYLRRTSVCSRPGRNAFARFNDTQSASVTSPAVCCTVG